MIPRLTLNLLAIIGAATVSTGIGQLVECVYLGWTLSAAGGFFGELYT